MANPIVTFEMENGDINESRIISGNCPNTVEQLYSLVQNGFYDGLTSTE